MLIGYKRNIIVCEGDALGRMKKILFGNQNVKILNQDWILDKKEYSLGVCLELNK